MLVYDYDPVRALQIVDSAVLVGNMEPWRADMNRVRIYSQTRAGERLDSLMHWPAGTHRDTARAIGERLLSHDSIRSSLAQQQNVLEILAYTVRQQDDTTAWLRYSRQLVDVCRQQGEETEALRNEAEMGAAMCWLGRQAAGMALLDSVTAVLGSREPFRFNELDALVIAIKRKIGVMTKEGQTVEVLPLARRIVTLMDDYEQHPDRYRDGSYREPPEEVRTDYIRFYRAQAQNFIAAAYAVLGQSKDMKASFEQLENIVREADTREHLARYRALEQQMEAERQQLATEARAQRNALLAWAGAFLALFALVFATVLFRKNKAIRQKNRILAQQLTELYDNTRPASPASPPTPLQGERGVDTYADERQADVQTTPLSPWRGVGGEAELYRHIREEVIRLQLYTDPGFGRQSVIERFHLTKDVASRVFSQGSEHANISDFINNCRLDHARRLLVSRPDMSIADIAAASGFGVRTTFSRCFKAKHGLTPTEFREQQNRE